MDKIEILKNMINDSKRIVVLTGAGVSTDSGIKDFRSKDGLYNMKNNYDYPPEYLLSSRCFYDNTKDFFKYYKENMNVLNYEPNITHKYLKKLEDEGKLKAVITQNIDGLHTKAGNKNVYEVHGTINKNKCIKCNKEYDANYIFSSKDIPTCECGGIIKPDVVLYGEMLPNDVFEKAENTIYKCDMLMILGTSLTVYPASGLVNLFNGKYLVIINNDETPFDDRANLVINDNLSNVFSKIYNEI